MKSGEKRALWAVLAGGVGILALTVYLESNYQQREARIDRTHAVKDSAVEPSPTGLDARVIPKGLNPLDLPDADGRGATLLTLYCVQCHDLPTPLMHSAGEWPAILDRMQRHMGSRSTGMLAHVIMLAEKDWRELREYLNEFAQTALDSSRFDDLDSPAGQTFQSLCSQCHATPSPSRHTAREWPRVVLRMKVHMRNAGKDVPNEEATQQVVNYLQKHGKPEKRQS